MQPVAPVITSVFHPTDFSEGSDRAFAHALAAAVVARTSFTIMGIGSSAEDGFGDFPQVRETLARWGVLSADVPREQVESEIGVRVKKVSVSTSRPVKAVSDYVTQHAQDLVVIASHSGATPGWVRAAPRVAERTRAMTLFVPSQGRGFVSPEDGSLSLSRVLLPIATTPDPQVAVLRASRVAEALGEPEGEVILLHVGDAEGAPGVTPPGAHPWNWRNEAVQGDVIDEIVAAADRLEADLIVMATDGKDGILDLFRGSHSERVLRRAPCPVLAIPV